MNICHFSSSENSYNTGLLTVIVEDVVMRQIIKITFISLMVLLLAFSSLIVLASASQKYLFNRNLQITNFAQSDSEDSYVAFVTDSGQNLSHIFIRIEHPAVNSNRVPILFSMWHAENTELDSLTLRFSTEPSVTTLLFEATSYNMPLEFHQTGKDVLFSVKDLGLYGEGTVTLDFTLIKYSSGNLVISVDFSMHYVSPLQLTALNGHSSLNTQLPS